MDRQLLLLTGLVAVVGIVAAASVSHTFSLFSQDVRQEQYAGQRMSAMTMTSFDAGMAQRLMDENMDGMCDFCGMRIEDCIASGMMECTMDPGRQVGVLGSQHIHADIKIYVNGKAFDLSGKSHMERMRSGQKVSSFIHVDSVSGEEQTGDVIHMHATGVPLWIFFDSIELKLPDDARTYANGKEIQNYRDYVFKDLDKILITDGIGSFEEQSTSITDFAKNH